ncbi:MAG: YeeE/YedE family protein [Bdellovibrionales bacterium]|nr:YeeE/YedE family protein [Bdellovibrionales bacterium]
MRSLIATFFVAFLFSLGLGISGMTQPQKVISFLDIFGNWDPSLAFVMMGAITVHFLSYRWIVTHRRTPVLKDKFLVPPPGVIDFKLLSGSVLFGVGWGLAGFCPAPAITSLATLQWEILVFVPAMLAGMFIHRAILADRKSPQ